MKRHVLLIAASVILPVGEASAAVLIGSTVSEQYYFPDESTPYAPTVYVPQTFTVGAGQESSVVLEAVTTFNVDFADTALDVAFDTVLSNPTFGASAFNGLIFTSTAFSQITGVTVNPSTNLAGFDASRVSVVGNDLKLNWNGLSYSSDTLVSLEFLTAPVPEPSTWMMMIAGFGLIGAGMRNRRKSAARFAF